MSEKDTQQSQAEEMKREDIDLEAGIDEEQPLIDHRDDIWAQTQVTQDQLLSSAQQAILESAALERTNPEMEAAAAKETFISAVLPLIGLSIFSVLASWLIGKYKFSLLWLGIVGAAIFVVIRRRLHHFNLYHIHYLRREAAKIPLGTQLETTEWINHIMDRVWMVAEPIISSQVIERANIIFKEKKPGFLDSLELTTFTLGSRAPALLGAKVHPDVATNLIYLDLDACFVPNDTSETNDIISARRNPARGQQWDSKIVLTARVGKGMIAVPIPVLVKNITFLGKLRIQLELMPNIPFAKQVEVGFMEMPKIDFVLKPLKGLDMMDTPGLSRFINTIISTVLGQIAVSPNRITLNIAELLAGRLGAQGKAVGVLKVEVFGARGVKHSNVMGILNSFEPYIRISVAGQIRAETVQLDSDDLEWNEVFYLLVPTVDNPITVELMSSATAVIGKATIKIDEFTSSPVTDWYNVANTVSGEARGELNLGFQYYSIINPDKPAEDESSSKASSKGSAKGKEPIVAPAVPTEFHSGVLRFTIHGAKNLVRKESNVLYEVSLLRDGVTPPPVTHLAHYDPNIIRSNVRKQSSAPTWEESYELLIADPSTDSVAITFMTKSSNVMSNLVKESKMLGCFTAKVSEVLGKNEWFDLSGGLETAKMHATFSWRPIAANLQLSGGIVFIPPIGVLDLQIKSGINLSLLDIIGVGSNKYYVKVNVSGRVIGETEAFEMSGVDEGLLEGKIPLARGIGAINPLKKQSISTGRVIWNAYFHPIIRAHGDYVTLEVFASSTVRKNSLIGRARLAVTELVSQPGTPINKSVVLESESGKESDQQVIVSMNFLPVCDKNEEGIYQGDPTNNCGILECPSIVASNLYDSIRKTKVLCQVGTDKDDPILFDAESETSPAVDGSCTWSRRVELFVNGEESKHLVVQLTEKKMVRGDELLGTCLIPFDKLEEEHSLADHPTGKLKLDSEFIPLQGHLEAEPRDAGYLTINVISAKDLLPVDGGTSDPFVVLKLNDDNVGKTEEIRKTLNPTWNKAFRIPIFRHKRASLQIEIRDWNRIQASKTIGTLFFDLKTLQANEEFKSFDLPLDTVARGSVQFDLNYQLDEGLMQKMREETRNILMAGLHGVGDLGAGVAGGVVEGAGAVGKGALAIGSGIGQGVEKGIGVVGAGIGSGFSAVGSGLGTVGSGFMTGFGKVIPGGGKRKESTPVSPVGDQQDPQAAPVAGSGDIDVTIVGLVVPEELHAKAPQFDCSIRARFEGSDYFKTQIKRDVAEPTFNEKFHLSFSKVQRIQSVDFVAHWNLKPDEVSLPPGMDRPTYTVPMADLVEAAAQHNSIKLHLDSTDPAPELVITAEPSTASHSKSVFGRLMRRDSRGH